MENIFYVYTHTRNDTGSVFYVGKGKGRRAFWRNGRNKHWHAIVEKHGYSVTIAANCLSEEQAFSIEKEMISFYGRANLVNYTDGGDGASGAIRSDELKAMMRSRMLGRVFSHETIELMRASAKNRPKEHREKQAAAIKGRKLDDEHKRKISEAGLGRVISIDTRQKISAFHKGKKKNPEAVAKMAASKSKAVICNNNGKIYKSMSEAARDLGIRPNHISDVCRGIAKQTCGYTFRIINETS